MKRKAAAAVLFVLLMLGTAACASTETVERQSSNESAALTEQQEGQSSIEPMALTEEQRELLNLVSLNEKQLLFSFHTEEPCTGLSFWVETYQNGEKTEEEPAALELRWDQGELLEGKCAVIMKQKDESTEWGIVCQEKGTRASGEAVREIPGAWSVSGGQALEQPCEIRDRQDIVLYAGIFTENTTLNAFATQDFLEEDTIEQYEYVQLLKCRFELSPAEGA